MIGRTLIDHDSTGHLALNRLLAFLDTFQRFARFAGLCQHPGRGSDRGGTLKSKVPRSHQPDPAFDQRTRLRPITLEEAEGSRAPVGEADAVRMAGRLSQPHHFDFTFRRLGEPTELSEAHD